MIQNVTHWTDDLAALGACQEAIDFGAGFDSLEAAWQACDRSDWMLWLLGALENPKHWTRDADSTRAAMRAAIAAVCVEYIAGGLPETLKACADIVRQHYPTAPTIGGS